MEKLLISVIIPCYNIEQHLSKCIESILAQSYTNFELLLIDDGSIDSTLEVCHTYQNKDSRIKVFTHPNRGVSYTRNRGIELATGEHIIFIDGDDYIKEDYLEKLLSAYEPGTWPLCGMTIVRNGHSINNNNFTKLLLQYPTGTIARVNFLDLLKGSSLSSPCARLYSREIIVINRLYFDESVSYQEDLLFNLAYSKFIDSATVINSFGYHYVNHSISSTGRYHKNFNHIDLVANDLMQMVRTPKDKELVQEFIFQTILRKISNCFHPHAEVNKKELLAELKKIFQSKSFICAEEFIFKSKINIFLKLILKIRNPVLLKLYYKLLHS